MIHYRIMEKADLPAALQLCRLAHWNQLARDWELFLNVSPDGCWVATKNGVVIGSVATVKYQEKFCWIGMVLVNPAERGQGIGTQLLQQALTFLKEFETVKLDATPVGREVYVKLGFVDEYPLKRLQTKVSDQFLIETSARPMTEKDLAAVGDFDEKIFGASRRELLQWMFDGAREYSWLIEYDQAIKGFCLGRHGANFEHLGPIVAVDEAHARQLVSACLRNHIGREFILDSLSHHSNWTDWLHEIGFVAQRPFMRMVCGNNQAGENSSLQFAIAGPEFG